MSTRQEREEWRRLVAERDELMTTGVNRLSTEAWWAAAVLNATRLASAPGTLLADVERLEAERDALRAWVARAREALALARDGVVHPEPAEIGNGPRMRVSTLAAIWALLADAPKEET